MTTETRPLNHPPYPSLYVGDLHPDVTEADLRSAFFQFGHIFSIRVCRDRATRVSLRYAYVNFFYFADAENALKTMNHCLLHGTPIRIMWSQRNPQFRRQGIGNLFVKNLEFSMNGLDLENLFSVHGTVQSCKVAMDENGCSKGFGFVQMDSEASAQSAIEALNGIVLPGSSRKLYVSKFIRRSKRQSRPVGRTNLYIKNLDQDITDAVLEEKLSEYGSIDSTVVMKDKDGMSRGFGFVNFLSRDDAKNALENLNGSKLGSKTIYVGYAQKRSERDELLKHLYGERRGSKNAHNSLFHQGCIIYVKFLDASVNDVVLREHFGGCGNIYWTKVVYTTNGKSRGFGFVRFSSPEEAINAIHGLNGSMLNGKRLYVTIAWNKNDARTLQVQNANLEFTNMQHAMPHDFSSFYPVANYGWLPNQLQANMFCPYQQPPVMIPFLGTQGCSNEVMINGYG
ncbi:polyadenylate-binding protein 7-like [Canna indica]|uniref:Polyadenylate-binding protein 7-like n=1 Tax=Canna indica TaxID=4628 RepID=A0AAQ3Q664_9LILI|nr:polyadenylate-binding protein 7-like [Canna indica]